MTFSSSRCGADCNLFYRVNPDQQTLNNIAELVEKTYEIDGVTGFTPLGEETSVFTWSKVPKFSFGPEVGEMSLWSFSSLNHNLDGIFRGWI